MKYGIFKVSAQFTPIDDINQRYVELTNKCPNTELKNIRRIHQSKIELAGNEN